MVWVHNLDPTAFTVSFLEVHWYGIAYALAFLLGWLWLRRLSKKGETSLSLKQTEDLIFAIVLGVIIGSRLGYFLLYNPADLFSLEIFKIWQGGMSFHGGLVGVLLAIWYLARRWQKSFLELTDLIVIPVAIGLLLGRLGNFVNGELWGKPVSGGWGVIFPNADELPRYPSQLFEAAKNLIIAGVLFLTFRQKPKQGILSFLFLTLYGFGRILVEIFWREPLDGFILGMPKGAFYSLPILIVGIVGLIWVNYKTNAGSSVPEAT